MRYLARMNRRDFLRAASSGAAAWGVVPFLPGQDDPTSVGIIPADKGFGPAAFAALRQRGSRRVWRGAERFTIGMPIGGICAGQLYLLGDGTLGGWHVDGRHNPTGYGSANYRAFRPPRELEQGFLLETKDATGDYRRCLLADEEYGGGYDAIEFVGEYPVGEVRYLSTPSGTEKRSLPPVRVTMRAYSPFLPLNAADSSLPCTVLRFEVVNDGPTAVEGFVTGFLENGVERDALNRAGAPRWRNHVRGHGDLVSVLMDCAAPDPGERRQPPRPERVLADFEGGDYGDWRLEGAAFGEKPAAGTLPSQQAVSGFEGKGLVNTFLDGDPPTGKLTSTPVLIDRHYLTMLVGGGGHANETCVNLRVGDVVVRTVTGKNNERLEPVLWDVREFEGVEATIEIVDAASGPWGHINVDRIALADELPEHMQRPRPEDLTFGTMGLSFVGEGVATVDWHGKGWMGPDSEPMNEGDTAMVTAGSPRPAGLGGRFALAPGARTELVFLVTWHFPNLHTGQRTNYAGRFADAFAVAQHVAENDARLWRETELFRKTVYEDTTLPWWLVSRLFMPVANLATGTAQWWDNGRFWGWEGVGCCSGTCTHVWNYSHAEARLFPELSRANRVMQDLGTGYEEATGRVAFRGERDRGFAYAADGQAGTVLKCYREHLMSADDGFLRANWPRIRQVLEYQIAKDAELSPDGKPDGVLTTNQHNTYDIDFYGPNTMVGSMYLAALLAGAAMARLMGEDLDATRYLRLYESGRAWTEKNLFNGAYYTQAVPPGDTHPYQYGKGCLSDQLFGQSWARLLGLGTVYDEAQVRTALASIYRHNFAPAVGTYNAVWPPERYFARERDPGLLLCTWPEGGRPQDPVRYKDEVWTGIEYQVATSMVWEGLVDEALALVKAIDTRYDGLLHNPWNEVECGDHYARAMASYGVWQALAGFEYDGPALRLGMAPRLAPEEFFSAFFTAAEGWGVLMQLRTTDASGSAQRNRIEVRGGKLRLREFRVEPLHEGVDTLDRLVVKHGTEPVSARMRLTNGRARAILDRPLTIAAGEVLDFSWQWKP